MTYVMLCYVLFSRFLGRRMSALNRPADPTSLLPHAGIGLRLGVAIARSVIKKLDHFTMSSTIRNWIP